MDRDTASVAEQKGSRTPRSVFGHCPAHWLLRQLGDRWSVPVLSALSLGPKRFSQLREDLQPISPKMLDSTLKKLIRIGFVKRCGTHSQIYYELTALGLSSRPAVRKLLSWPLRQNVMLYIRESMDHKA